jgi:hypothetical protein
VEPIYGTKRLYVSDTHQTEAKWELAMPENFERLVEKYHAFYEVSPYRVLVEEGHGSPTATRQIIQAGFEVDVHGVSNKREPELPPAADYALGRAELEKIAKTVSHHATDCVIQVIPFPSSAFFEGRQNSYPEAILRIQISHRGVDQPSGRAEEDALSEIEKQLQGLGIRRR